ncbi:MAG TPA: NADH-quinone oxidoreductase subunit NuoG [Candidatus Acidoferrales bacterium]
MADQVTVTIDEQKVSVGAGSLVIEAAKALGISIPSFCYYPGLSLQGACRMCLVEVEKVPKLQTACTLVAQEGMVVRTQTRQVVEARKSMVEFLLTNHPLDCPVCDKGGECELQDMTVRYGLASSRFVEEKIHIPEQKFSPLVYFDAPRCILCFRCVRVCDEAMDVKALGVGERGAYSVILPNQGERLDCEECGMCIDICPVGALTSGTYRYKTRPWELRYVGTICTHCGDGCKTTLGVRADSIVRANNRDRSGVNGEFLCAKGRFGFDFTESKARLRQPLIRRDGRLQPASWEEAFEWVAARLKGIRKEYGREAIGVAGSSRNTNEECYLLQRYARQVLGTPHIDHVRSADYGGLVAGVSQSAGASFARCADFAEARTLLLIGNDPTQQHPLLAYNLRQAVRRMGARLFILGFQEIKLKRQARQMVVIPEGEMDQAIGHLLRGKSSLPRDVATQLDDLKTQLAAAPEMAVAFGSEVTGESIYDLVAFATAGGRMAKIAALGDYVNSRGASDMGALPEFLPGYVRTNEPGMTLREMFRSRGKIRALHVVGSDPAKELRLPAGWRNAFELVVVQDLFLTATAQDADAVFPAASLYEKDGTVTNTYGEVQPVRRAIHHASVRTDFDIIRILAQLMGGELKLRSPESAWEEIRVTVPGYGVSTEGVLVGQACKTTPKISDSGRRIAANGVFSANDTLFTSGTLGEYCEIIQSLPEAQVSK